MMLCNRGSQNRSGLIWCAWSIHAGFLPGSGASARYHSPGYFQTGAPPRSLLHATPALPINCPTASVATDTPVLLLLLILSLCFPYQNHSFGLILILHNDKWHVGERGACNLLVWRKNGFRWVGACSIACPSRLGPLVLGGRGRGMEDESSGLLPIKETDMKYYVYVSTPIALVGSFSINCRKVSDYFHLV